MGNLGRLLALSSLACVLAAPAAVAEPASGPREDIDQNFTTTTPATPTGTDWSGSYHAAGDPNGNPPYMRKMVFHPPSGFRYDTSVPDKCTAGDAELSLRGPDACPPGSRLGGGTTDGIFYVPFTNGELDRYHHSVYILNNTNEQIMLVESEGFTVVRGHMQPDGSVEFAGPTCFPPSPTGQCAKDYVLQTKSVTSMPVYTDSRGSYATTPPECPASGHWESTVEFFWADGSQDSVVSNQPCSP
jgi:hypothetical protein